MEQLPLIPFFDSANADQFWQFVYALMFVVAPILVIMFATDISGYFIRVIREVFTFERFRRRDDESFDDE